LYQKHLEKVEDDDEEEYQKGEEDSDDEPNVAAEADPDTVVTIRICTGQRCYLKNCPKHFHSKGKKNQP
jgi:hypothetical protein